MFCWCISSQTVLDSVRKLSKYFVGNVGRRLRDEINANAFRTDKLYYLNDLIKQLFGMSLNKR